VKAHTDFSFGLVADCQYADRPDFSSESYQRYFRRSAGRLAEAVAEFNNQELSFIKHLGDLVDGDPAVESAVPLEILSTARVPVRHVLGNHDFANSDGSVADAAELCRRYRMPARYYSFPVPGWRFVILDSNELGVIASAPGTEAHVAGVELLADLARSGAINAHPWNGTISRAQREWLDGQLVEAERAGERVAVLSHHPMDDRLADSMLAGDELAAHLAQHPAMALALSGHHHFGQLRTVHGVPMLTAHGMVETTESAFAVVHVRSDHVLVQGFGRQPDHRLELRDPRDPAWRG
jgi:3',5'-cyclic AMP phosphodiesterase CpdA